MAHIVTKLAVLGAIIAVGYALTDQRPAGSSAATSASSPKGYDENASRRLCEAAVQRWANHPSTVDFHSIMGYGTAILHGGTRRIAQDFSAKNAFGLGLTYRADCEISPDGKLVHFAVSEKGGQPASIRPQPESQARYKCFGETAPGSKPHCWYEK